MSCQVASQLHKSEGLATKDLFDGGDAVTLLRDGATTVWRVNKQDIHNLRSLFLPGNRFNSWLFCQFANYTIDAERSCGFLKGQNLTRIAHNIFYTFYQNRKDKGHCAQFYLLRAVLVHWPTFLLPAHG